MSASRGRWILTFFFLFSIFCTSWAQKILTIKVDGDSALFAQYANRYSWVSNNGVQDQLKEVIAELQNEGYLTASIDEYIEDSLTVTATVHTGRVFGEIWLGPGNLPDEYLSSTRLKKENARFSHKEINNLFDQILGKAENNGFPFSRIALDSISINEERISASINFDSGPLITFDSLIVSGKSKIKPRYLSKSLNISRGEPYAERLVKEAPEKLSSLDYVQIVEDPKVSFYETRANVIIGLRDRRVNQFDFVLGLLPNQSDDGSLLVTGQLDLSLKNMFGTGKELDLFWRRFKQESQEFDLSYLHPFIFHSPVDLDLRFDLLKEDSTYLSRQLHLGFLTSLGPRQKIGIGWLSRNTSTLSGNMIEPDVLPGFNSTRTQAATVEYRLRRSKPSLVKDNGLNLIFSGSVGAKEVERENEVSPEVYDSIDFNSSFFQLDLHAQYMFRIRKSLYLFNSLMAGWMNRENFFSNDAYRFGGFGSLRGFNEKTFFARYFVANQMELRLYFSESGHVFIFYDQGFLENRTQNDIIKDEPVGLGLGFSLETRSGLFKFAYAFGQSDQQDITSQNAKIHFGYTATF